MVNENAPSYRGGSSAGGPRRPGLKPRRTAWRAWVAALAWYGVTALVLALPLTFSRPYATKVGERAHDDVKALYEFSVVDQMETDRQLERLQDSLDHVWKRDDEMISRARQKLQSFMSLLRDENPAASEQLRSFVQKLDEQFDLVLDMSTVNQFQDNKLRTLRPPLSLGRVQTDLSKILSIVLNNYSIIYDEVAFEAHRSQNKLRVMNNRNVPLPVPKPDEVLVWPQGVSRYLSETLLPRYFPNPDQAELRQAALALLMNLLGANLEYDKEDYAARLNQKAKYLDEYPIEKQFKPGDLIAKQGEPINPLQADALDKLNKMERNSMAIKIAGIMLLTAIFYAAVGFYLVRFRREVVLDASMVTLHVLPPLMAIAIGQAMEIMKVGDNTIMIWYPAAMVGLLAAILLTPQVAFVLTLVGTCLFGIVTGQALSFLVYALFGGFAAVFASRRVRARGEVLLVGAQVGLVNVVTLVVLRMLMLMPLADLSSLLGAFLGGIAAAFGTLVLLVLFERMFGIITDLRLLELTGLRNPLIAQFEEKSPGSYQHVLSVVKLAEAAAQAIGANYLLTRAGAYFHDIGKMIKPKYFSENQVTLDDKKAHSRLSPYMSVLIIKNHVKEGVELARRYHLPQKVVDFIPQHHGTGLIRYFYSEAIKRYTESGAVDEPREEDFRYPGPKPQSIEAAVVMLADSVEAVASSKFTGGQVSEGELRKLVQTAITEKFDDGQFDECDLTMRHLHLIRESFVKTLMGRFHFRVAYPTLPPKREAAPRIDAREPAIAIAGPGGAA